MLTLSYSFSHQDTFSFSFSLVDENLLNFSFSFSRLLVLVTQVSHQNEYDHTQDNHTLNHWCQYCYSLVGLPNLNKSRRLLIL